MQDTGPTWLAPLRSLPRVEVIGAATHGTQPPTIESWQLMMWVILLIDYHAELALDEHVLTVAPGTLGVFPPCSQLTVEYASPSRHLYAHFALPHGRADEMAEVACLTELGPREDAVRRQLETAIGCFPVNPRRTERLLLDVMHVALAHPATDEHADLHPGVRRAVAYIEANLVDDIDIPSVADVADVSPRQLSTLFRRSFDTTVVGYIAARRVDRARRLLTTTDLPIKAVAAHVGITDLHYFNKVIRRYLGASPRAIRATGSARR
ncbi:MAG TPA: AraC family transcriptional regulator [Nocardioidaceae bacterium]|nr:AraC family transcriptional regulator [Nocardioidaceae bacterium]